MKIPFLLKLATFCAAALTAFAVDRVPPAPGPEVLGGGLQVSLSTSGYKFIAADAPVPVASTKGRESRPAAARDSFAASALLVNRSGSEVAFTFPNPPAAERHWTFRVFDSAGGLVWESDADVIAAQVTTEANLGKSARWKRNILVPLKLDGKWLAPGSYTLEASIDADRQLGATAIFQIVPPLQQPPTDKNTGIKGRVSIATGGAGVDVENPFVGAFVQVRPSPSGAGLETHPLVWSGYTDALGEFQVPTTAGKFLVSAVAIRGPAIEGGAAGLLPVAPKAVEVTVETGKFSEVSIRFIGSNPPTGDTGIRGQVFIGPISPVAVVGEPNEAPLAGAPVRVEEILEPVLFGSVGAPLRKPFFWMGVTDREGRFKVAGMPPGTFRVTASNHIVVIVNPKPEPILLAALGMPMQLGAIVPPAPPKLGFGIATAEVKVELGKVSEVSMHIDSGIR